MNKQEQDTGNQQTGIIIQKKQLVLFGVVFAAVLAGGVAVAFNWNNWFGKEPVTSAAEETAAEESKSPLELDPNAGNWDGKMPQETAPEDVGIKIPGYPSIDIQADSENVMLPLMNPEGNPCYFHFTVVLNDTQEVLYESKYVPPGQAITDVTLSRALPAGEYTATIQISTLSLDGETPLNGANVETVLVAK